MCHDLLFEAGVLGNTCHDEADMDDPVSSPSLLPTPTDSCDDPTTKGIPFIGLPCLEDDPIKPTPVEEPPVCTPDGPPCPPCPEGIEAGWCADEDEQQDVDDCLTPEGEERYPGCSGDNDNDLIIDEDEGNSQSGFIETRIV
jgi:hypothetical protein